MAGPSESWRQSRVRIDKWLWAARFYKTRSLAAQAVAGGKVHLNGARVKPARALEIGDRLQIRKGEYQLDVEVRALSSRRGPAAVARALYEETPESVAAREALREQRRLEAAAAPRAGHRPDKKGRRQLRRLRERSST